MSITYDSMPYINNSALSKINPEEGGNPETYHKFILEGPGQSKAKHFVLGTNLHFIFLEDKEPVVIPSMPSPAVATIIETVLEEVKRKHANEFLPFSTSLESHEELLLKTIRESSYQNNWKDETVINDVLKKGETYWDTLLSVGNSPIVSDKEAALINLIRMNLAIRPFVAELLSTKEEEGVEYFTEMSIVWEEDYTGQKMKCKSRLDRLRINHKTRTFSIRDFKSNGSPLEQFAKSFENFRYYRQIRFYEKAAMKYLESKGLHGYTPEAHYIIAAETFGLGRVRPFRVTPGYLYKGEQEIKELLNRIAIHTTENQWVLSLEEQHQAYFDLVPSSY